MRLKNVWWSTLSTIIQISWSLQILIFWKWSLTTGSPSARLNILRKSRNAFVRALSKDRALFFCLQYPAGHYRCTCRFFFFSVTKLSPDWLIYRRMRYLNINGHYDAMKKVMKMRTGRSHWLDFWSIPWDEESDRSCEFWEESRCGREYEADRRVYSGDACSDWTGWKRIDNLLKSAILLVGNPTTLGGDFMEAVKDYDVHIDSKKRVTLRGAKYQYYNVREYENGCIMLEPRELPAWIRRFATLSSVRYRIR